MTVEEALTHVDYAGPSDRRDTLPCTVVAAKTLANEVRRLRAAVEAVRALPYLDWDAEHYRDDVLAALEITDD